LPIAPWYNGLPSAPFLGWRAKCASCEAIAKCAPYGADWYAPRPKGTLAKRIAKCAPSGADGRVSRPLRDVPLSATPNPIGWAMHPGLLEGQVSHLLWDAPPSAEKNPDHVT